MKRIIATIIAVIIMSTCLPIVSYAEDNVSVWDGVSVTADWASDYNPDDKVAQTFEINSAADFMAFRNKVLEVGLNKPFASKTVNLNCDIDLNNYNLRYGVGAWTDFSGEWYQKSYFFRGVFNGNGHIIKNVKMDQTQPDQLLGTSNENGAIGLFTTDMASFNNLGVENVTIVLPSSSNTTVYCGGFASISYRTDITGCYVKNVKFSGGWSGSKTARIGGLSAYHRQKDLKNSYVNGIDFTGLNTAIMPNTFIGGLVCSGDGDTNIANCYSANVFKNLSGQGNFDRAVFILNPSSNGSKWKISLTNVYTDAPLHQGQGSAGSGHTGTLEDAMEDVEENLGSAYTDLSDMGMYPILAWEKIPPAYEYDDLKYYQDYGETSETEISSLTASNGKISAVISGLKNNTSNDLENAIFCLACIDDKKLCGINSKLVSVNGLVTLDTDIVLTIDLTGIELSENGFIQVLAYKGIDTVVPIMSINRVER